MPEAVHDPVPPQWFWDRYWQADRVAACLTEAPTGNYQPAIRDAWERFFKDIGDGARMLDIGTGNGAVAIIAFETAARGGRHFEIHGVDRADINPAGHVHLASAALADIRFHGRTAAESLPFPDAHFDVITGQYALEYSHMERSLPELGRVAGPGARLRFILHARDARPVIAASATLDDIRYVLVSLGLLDKARALLHAVFAFEYAGHYDADLEARARQARDTYLAAARAANERYAHSLDKPLFEDILVNVSYAWDHRREYTLDYLLKGMDAVETEVRAHQARLENMCAVALTEAQSKNLGERFHASGFEDVSLTAFRTPGEEGFWGWELTARKPEVSAPARRGREDGTAA